jgi:hypothetical protein
MFGEIRPDFEVVKEGRILHYSLFLLCFKVSGDRSSFAKHHPFPSPETIPEPTRINLVTSEVFVITITLQPVQVGFLCCQILAKFLTDFITICLNLKKRQWRFTPFVYIIHLDLPGLTEIW